MPLQVSSIVCAYVHMYICTYVHVHVYIFYICTYVHNYMYTYIHILHMHIHMCTQPPTRTYKQCIRLCAVNGGTREATEQASDLEAPQNISLLSKSIRRTISHGSEASRVLKLHGHVSAIDTITQWLCKRGRAGVAHHNGASYGPCAGTLFHHLEMTGLPTSEVPGFAGVSIELVVLKQDFYNQTIASDSSSTLQLYSALDGEKVNDATVSFRGSIFTGFEAGVAKFSIAVKPTFVEVTSTLATLLSQPHVYASGRDVDTSLSMETDVRLLHLSQGNVDQYPCPTGHELTLDAADTAEIGASRGGSGACNPCEAEVLESLPHVNHIYRVYWGADF